MTAARRWSLVLAGLALLAGPARAQTAPDPLIGAWVGTYTCAQGLTAVRITIAEASSSGARAMFHFYADPRNPQVPTGCYLMDGAYDPATRQVVLRAGRWIVQPLGYVGVDFVGTLDATGTRLAGEVRGPRCTAFELRKTEEPPAARSGCSIPIATRSGSAFGPVSAWRR